MNSGIIRKIDVLGRIVIPMEIRRSLHIKEGDPLEISLSGKGIRLERYSGIAGLKQLSDSFMRAMAKDLQTASIICNLDTVISCQGISLSEHNVLSGELQAYIRKQEHYRYSESTPLYLTAEKTCLINALYPIGTRQAPSGAFILLRSKDEDTTAVQEATARTIALVLSELTK